MVKKAKLDTKKTVNIYLDGENRRDTPFLGWEAQCGQRKQILMVLGLSCQFGMWGVATGSNCDAFFGLHKGCCAWMVRFFAYIRMLYLCGLRFFSIVMCLSLDHVTMWKCFLLLLCRVQRLRFFCLYKGCCVCAALFFYCCVFVIIPCDHEKMFPSFVGGMHFAFFAYIRHVGVGCAFFCIVMCLLLSHVTMWKSFFFLQRFFCLYKECCFFVCGALFSIVVCLLWCHVTMRKCFHVFFLQRFFAYIRNVEVCMFCMWPWEVLSQI